MKFLIWFFCLFVAAVIHNLCKMSGIMLGGLPAVLLYGGAFWYARHLCECYDLKKENADAEENGPNSETDTLNSECSNMVTFTLPANIASTIVVKNLSEDKVLWEGTGGEKIHFEVDGEMKISVTWDENSISYTVCGGKMYVLTDNGFWRTKWEIAQI